jgi:transcriptional regulator GlxA family with amidase domain
MTRYVEIRRFEVPLVLGVRFRPAGAVPFLGYPAAEITDLNVPVETLWGARAARLLDRLAEVQSIGQRLEILERALLEHLRPARRGDPPILYAANLIATRPSFWRTSGLASEVGLSPRQFRRRFESAVGIGPKRFARIVRFQKVLATALTNSVVVSENGWARLALDAGFFDQAHLNRDFREFTGMSPARFLATRSAS